MDLFDAFEDLISDEDEDLIQIVDAPRRLRVFRVRPNHFEYWDDMEFVQRFRLSKRSVELILEQTGHHLLRPTDQNHALSPATQVLVALRFYATGSMLVVAGDFGGIHKSTACHIIQHVSQLLASLAPQQIRFPTTEEEQLRAKRQFRKLANFPNVIGAIDCTHVRIQSPGGELSENFRNRKGYFSINVQTTCDADLKITNIVARWPGATHGSTIWMNSRLRTQFEEGHFRECFLLGDSGYALAKYLMTPLTDPRTEAEILYNESQIRTRNAIERKYGVWKRRFPILKLEMRLKLDTIQAIIVAVAVLHNIAIAMNDEEPADGIPAEENPVDDNVVLNPENNGLEVQQNLIREHFML